MNNLSSDSTPIEPRAHTSHGKRPWVIGAVVLLLACCVGFGLLFGILGSEVNAEQPKVQAVLQALMTAMANKDTQTAASLFVAGPGAGVPVAELDRLLEGSNYVLFDGYRELTVTGLVMNATFNNNPDEPQGVTARVQATISYDGGYTGTIHAVLRQQGGEWRLMSFQVVVPPSKLKP